MSLAERTMRQRMRRAELSSRGICIDCATRKRNETSMRCNDCNKRMNGHQRRRYATRRTQDGSTECVAAYRDRGSATFSEIGDALGISRSRAEQIYHRAMAKLWRECKRRGIDTSYVIGGGFSSLAMCEKWASE